MSSSFKRFSKKKKKNVVSSVVYETDKEVPCFYDGTYISASHKTSYTFSSLSFDITKPASRVNQVMSRVDLCFSNKHFFLINVIYQLFMSSLIVIRFSLVILLPITTKHLIPRFGATLVPAFYKLILI